MFREFGNALLRVATKKAIELAVREATASESQEGKLDIGDIAPAAVTLVNAITEKADTRNWQTLPHDISYARIHLPAGEHSIIMRMSGRHGRADETINIQIRESKTTFFNLQSLETEMPPK